MAPTGALTVLHTFVGADGALPTGLMQAKDGTFYGTTRAGGTGRGSPFIETNGVGLAFKTTVSGAFTALHSFTGASDGCFPSGGLVQAADGNFYGTTSFCGSLPFAGTMYRMAPTGEVTTIHEFGPTGFRPSPLLLASDGKLYGATEGAEFGSGSLFVATTAGDVATIHTFTLPEGERPLLAPIQGTDGHLYGATFGSLDIYRPDNTSVGSLYQATTSGTVTVLHTFARADGERPYGTLTPVGDGVSYGTTFYGGRGRRGVLFRLTSSPP